MQDAREVLTAIARRIGVESLTENADGVVELVIAGTMPVYLHVLSETEIELSARIEALDGAVLTPDIMRAMLAANADDRTASRLSVEPGANRVVLCRPLELDALSEDAVIAEIESFVSEAADWVVQGASALRLRAARRKGTDDGATETLIRV